MRGLMLKGMRWLYQQLRESTHTSWETCRSYVDVSPSVILGPGSSVDVKYYPLNPGVCVKIEEDSQLFGRLIVQTPGATIRIGRRTQIGAATLISACGIEVGDDVLIAWDVTLLDNDSHSLYWDERKNDVAQCAMDYRQTPHDLARNKDWSVVPMQPIRIADKTWIGFGSTILKGVTIGEGAVVAAKSVVTRDVAPYSLVAGNPSRVIRRLERRAGNADDHPMQADG